ncbi:MAG: alginate lyase family protein [Candidatus Riflebacteria bacterium]|nr:alginate lyase family protein [Candidatus Riflebacteria bacterium]
MESGRDWFLNIFKYYNTLAYLKPEQTVGRVKFMLRRKFEITRFSPALVDTARKNTERIVSAGFEAITFNFNNSEQRMLCNRIKWSSSDYGWLEKPEKLWLYKLNYFDWIFDNKLNLQVAEYAILDWICKNADSRAETWEPYPMSRRLISWVKWLKKNEKNLIVSTVKCVSEAIECQLDRLFRDVEYHIQANHVITNLQAILAAVDYLLSQNFALHKDFKKIIDELINQLNLQFFADGGHFERSPMYHVEMMAAVEDIKNSLERLVKRQQIKHVLVMQMQFTLSLCVKKLSRMQIWLSKLTHPDGKVAMFGDSAAVAGNLNYEPKLVELLNESGFFIYRKKPIYFVLSASAPSPSFQPGHSHCDALSFELSFQDKKIVTDTGCGSYQNFEVREHCRKSLSHNIPQIEHLDQSEMYDSFKVGARAKVLAKNFDERRKLLEMTVLDRYGQKFTRKVLFGGNYIEVSDKITNRTMTGAFISVLHLSDEVKDITTAKRDVAAEFEIEGYNFVVCADSRYRISNHTYYKDFGKPAEGKKIIFNNCEGNEIAYVLRWEKA